MPSLAECGTRNGYRHGCRCEDCHAAMLAHAKRIREQDPEHTKAVRAAWRAKHRDSESERVKKWNEANPGKNAERVKAWRKQNREKYLAQKRNRYAAERVAGARDTSIDYSSIWTGACAICGDVLDMDLPRGHRLAPTIDHIQPVSKGGGHTVENLQWAHMVCNSAKGNR